jgi:hypothetical protein
MIYERIAHFLDRTEVTGWIVVMAARAVSGVDLEVVGLIY